MPVCLSSPSARVGTPLRPGKGQLGGGHLTVSLSAWVDPASAGGRLAGGGADQVGDRLGELGRLQRQAAHVVVADHVDEVLRADQHRELAEVHLGHHHRVVPLEDLAEVLGERVEVTQVDLRDVVPGLADAAAGRADRAVRRAPAEHEDLGLRRDGVVDLHRRQRVGDPVDLGLADADHVVVVARVVGDVAVAVALLEATDAVLETGGAGDRPRTREGLLVAQVGPEVGLGVARSLSTALVVGAGREGRVDRRAARRARGSATARTRWRGSRRRAASPACGR